MNVFRYFESIGFVVLELPATMYVAMGNTGTYLQEKSGFAFTAFKRN